MDVLVEAKGWLTWPSGRVRCALGRAGVRVDKREGDGATPIGAFPLREVLYRPDRVPPPATALPVSTIGVDDGWCDDPGNPDYNRPVRLPHAGRHERLWRPDALYDVLVVIGYNDAPPEPGRGSAIFLHLARSDFAATEGCIALALTDLLALLADCRPDDRLIVTGAEP